MTKKKKKRLKNHKKEMGALAHYCKPSLKTVVI